MPVHLAAQEGVGNARDVRFGLPCLRRRQELGLGLLGFFDRVLARRRVLRGERGGVCEHGEHDHCCPAIHGIYLTLVNVTPPPPGTASGATVICVLRMRTVTVRPDAMPTAAPSTTSLAQCWFS
jgi:hypothetical protein